jgi:hypothetical protein
MSFNDDYTQRRLLKRGKTLDNLKSPGARTPCVCFIGNAKSAHLLSHARASIRLYYCSARAIDLSALITPTTTSLSRAHYIYVCICKSNGACLLHHDPEASSVPANIDREEWKLESILEIRAKYLTNPRHTLFAFQRARARVNPFSIVPH